MGAEHWETVDGRVLEIAWMDSAHLVNSFNMLLRNNALTQFKVTQILHGVGNSVGHTRVRCMASEIEHRGYLNWNTRLHSMAQVEKVYARETPVQMCMLRAILDTESRTPNVNDFIHNREQVMKWVFDAPQNYPDLTTKFTEYRLR